MPTPNVVPKIIVADAAANRWIDQLLAVLNPILRNVAGDLTGPVAAPTVAGWLGRPLDPAMASPAIGDVPKWNGSAWAPGVSGAVSSVGALAPLSSSGGLTPIISLTGTVAAANGGTGQSSYSIGDLLVASGATALSRLAIGAAATVLTSDGTTASWQALPATGVTSVGALAPLASSGGTTPTISLTGIIPIANGGTNSSSTPTAGAVPYGTGTAFGWTAVGTTGYVLTSAGSGIPTWQPPTASFTGAGVGAYRATTSTPDTISLSDYVVDVTTTGSFTVNLPTAGSGIGQAPSGRVFIVKNSGGATVTVATGGSQLIDSAASFTIVTRYASFTFISTGTGWALL